MVTTPTIGQPAWGAPLNSALNDLQDQITNLAGRSDWGPADQGYVAWSLDPAALGAVGAPVAGTVTLVQVVVRVPSVANSLVVKITAGGSGLTAGQNFAGLYNSAGARIGVTADQSAAWTSVSTPYMPLTAPVNLPAGKYYVGVVANGTTPPTLARGNGTGAGNAGVTGADLRFSTAQTAQTSMPVSITPGTLTANDFAWWMGIR